MPDHSPTSPGRFGLEALYENAARLLGRAGRWRRALVSNVAPRSGDVIVQIGCGAGALAIALALAAPRALVIAVDPDEAALARARQRALEADAKIEFARGFGPDAAHLIADWAPNKIIASFVERPANVHEKRATIAAAHAALCGEGVLHLIDCGVSPTRFVHSLSRDKSLMAVENFVRPSADSPIGMLRGAGFVAAERTESFPSAAGAITLYRARVS
jgi:SAM-dependent methyltransferase